jgi:hypothetical protein
MMIRVLHILEATLGGTRRYIENILEMSDPTKIQQGLIYSSYAMNNLGFISMVPFSRLGITRSHEVISPMKDQMEVGTNASGNLHPRCSL